jgi:hypothetical protein
MWCSTFMTIPRDDKRNISGFENEGRSDNLLVRSQKAGATVSPAFQRLRNLRTSAAKFGGSLRLTSSRLTYKLVGMLSEKKPRLRDPERTRERLLQAGFREVYRSGFQSASIDTILAATNVTKGALYHHFDSKEDLGHAIIEEIVAKLTQDKW